MKKFKLVLAIVMKVLSIAAILLCIIAQIVIQVRNPDMTEMRMLIEYPWLIAFIPAILGFIVGSKMLE